VKLKQFPSLYQIFNDASPDYAVIAQKTGNAAELAQFDDLFNQVFGLSLHELANRYDSRIDTLDQRQTASEANIQRFNTNLQDFEQKLQEFEQKLLVVEDKNLLLTQRMAKILKIFAPFKWLKRQISKG
jgi:O-antigen chain-terminating methyltransferase